MMNINLDQFKNEIAAELGITLGADTTARENGLVGATMTKRLVELGKQQLSESTIQPHIIQQQEQQNQLH